jgi:hypothetical protein
MREYFENIHHISSPQVQDAMIFYNKAKIGKEIFIGKDFTASLK